MVRLPNSTLVLLGVSALSMVALTACDESVDRGETAASVSDTDTDTDTDTDPMGSFTATELRLFGSSGNDTVAGAVFDGEGNTYVIGQSEGLGHSIGSVYWARLNADGTVAWAHDLSSPDDLEGEAVRLVGDAQKGNGATRSIVMGDDGYLYVVAKGKGWSSSSTSFYASYAMKIDPASGEPEWTSIYRLGYPSGSSDVAVNQTEGASIAQVGDRVFVTAVGGSTNAVVLYELDGDNGELVQSVGLNMATAGSASRAITMVADPTNDVLYLGGWTSANFQKPAIAKVDISGDKLEFLWHSQLITPASTHVGIHVSDLDLDSDGNLYATLWIAGTYGWHELIKLAPDGTPQWGRRWGVSETGTLSDPRGSSRNDGMLVRVLDGVVYLGGRTGVQHVTWGDVSFGDSVLIAYDTEGEYLTHRYYFSGTASDDTNIDHVKGVGVLDDGRLAIAGFIWPNGTNFEGDWLNIDEVNDSGEALTTVPHHQMEIEGSQYTMSMTTGSDMLLIEHPTAEVRFPGDAGIEPSFQVRSRASEVTADDASTRAPSESAYRTFFDGFLPE
ncbi:MAG: hypothetical protein EA397_07025 [Deltaproteobacteria bacterium]|nr:MAG: hypothetical protein EA397_07025 [Deltaproteobacteria bacterium]